MDSTSEEYSQSINTTAAGTTTIKDNNVGGLSTEQRNKATLATNEEDYIKEPPKKQSKRSTSSAPEEAGSKGLPKQKRETVLATPKEDFTKEPPKKQFKEATTSSATEANNPRKPSTARSEDAMSYEQWHDHFLRVAQVCMEGTEETFFLCDEAITTLKQLLLSEREARMEIMVSLHYLEMVELRDQSQPLRMELQMRSQRIEALEKDLTALWMILADNDRYRATVHAAVCSKLLRQHSVKVQS